MRFEAEVGGSSKYKKKQRKGASRSLGCLRNLFQYRLDVKISMQVEGKGECLWGKKSRIVEYETLGENKFSFNTVKCWPRAGMSLRWAKAGRVYLFGSSSP